jgi:hypothetical protein
MSQRLVELAELAQADAKVVMGHGKIGPQPQGAPELLDRVGVSAQTL